MEGPLAISIPTACGRPTTVSSLSTVRAAIGCHCRHRKKRPRVLREKRGRPLGP
jgi:hypothetical protein